MCWCRLSTGLMTLCVAAGAPQEGEQDRELEAPPSRKWVWRWNCGHLPTASQARVLGPECIWVRIELCVPENKEPRK